MNSFLMTILKAGFVLLPIIVLGVRFMKTKRMPWWMAFLTVVLIGWLLDFAAAMLAEMPEGGAPKAFSMLFGWAHAIAWSLPWFLIYGAIQLAHKWLKSHKEHNHAEGSCSCI